MPYLNFKELAASIRIEDVADYLRLELKPSQKELRGTCSACQTDDDRALSVMPETNSFRCYAAKISGDCIALVAHINGTRQFDAAKELQEQFGTAQAARKVHATSPQKPGGSPSSPPASTAAAPAHNKGPGPFDPEEYVAKLQYTDDIAALGITEEDAARLGIGYAATGFHRGSVVLAIRNPDGTIAGFAGIKDGQLKLPTKWLAAKVVPLRKRA